QSPITSSDRAIGHSAPSKLVRFTMAASARVNYLVALLNQKAPNSSSALATQTGAYYEVGKQDGVNHGWQQRDRPGYRAAVRGGGRAGRHHRTKSEDAGCGGAGIGTERARDRSRHH